MSDSTKNNNKLALFIGQAPPEKNYEIPFAKTRLYHWLLNVGITQKEVLDIFDFEALSDVFPGKSDKGHKAPTSAAIKKYIPTIISKINRNDYKLIVPVGKLAIEYVLTKPANLKECIGKSYNICVFGKSKNTLVIPLPHPSGLSTWSFDKSNKKLLDCALQMIKQNTDQ